MQIPEEKMTLLFFSRDVGPSSTIQVSSDQRENGLLEEGFLSFGICELVHLQKALLQNVGHLLFPVLEILR